MLNGKFRPWGKVAWLFQMPSMRVDWFLIGAISTQDRCQSLLRHHGISLNLDSCGLLEIDDSSSAPREFSKKSSQRIGANRQVISQLVPSKTEIEQFDLLEPLVRLRRKIEGWIDQSNGNIIFDVSTLPERFCFPIIRWLVLNPKVNNLVVTYMLAESYTGEDLGYDSQDWGQLPTFVSDTTLSGAVEHVVVGVGFLPYSLTDWLKKTYSTRAFKISLLLPFPAPPSNVNRAWDFVRRIETDLGGFRDERQIIRVAPNDLWGAFQRIEVLTRQGAAQAVFAPYGPKPHSIAMSLHAIKHSSEAYFTQPTYYHPEYSSGILMDGTAPAGFAYAIRLNNTNFY